MYSKLKAEHDALLAERAANDSKPIKVTLPDGKQVDAESWKTTPYQIACGIRYDSILWYTRSFFYSSMSAGCGYEGTANVQPLS